MTIRKQSFINLKDIKAIHYWCICGATVSIPRERWGSRAQTSCPSCGVAPSHPTRWLREGEEVSVVALQNAIKDIVGFKNPQCEISIEVCAEEPEKEINA